MKTKIVVVLAFLIGGVAYGQHEIKIEFKQREDAKITLPKKIKRGDFYKVRVCDINLNRYSVQIKNEDSIISKSLELPTFEDFSLDGLTALTNNFLINSFLPVTEFDSLTSIESVDPKKLDDLKELIESAVTIAQAKTKEQTFGLTILKTTWDDLKFQIYKRRLNLLKEIPDNSDGYNFETALEAVEVLRSSSDSLKKSTSEQQKKYSGIVVSKKAKDFLEKPANKDLKEKVAASTKAFSTLTTKIDELKALITADNVEKLLKSILFLSDKTEYVSLPIQFKGELEELSISFVPKDSTSGLQTETLAPLIFPLENTWYWSVATSFYYSNLCNDRFSSLTSSDSDGNSTYTITTLESTSREAGISTTLRVGRKFRPNGLVGAHFNFGPGISIEKNIRPRLLFGGGISIGRKHNLTIDYGGILGYVDRLSDAIPKTGSGEVPDPLNTEIMIGNYFSLGYMFKI